MAGLKLVCMAVVCMVLASAAVDATISCGQVMGNLVPCIPYASSGVGAVPRECCAGIRNLNNAAKTTPDRQTACRCIKTAASSIRSINFAVVALLPQKCGVSIPFKFSPSIDCNGVK